MQDLYDDVILLKRAGDTLRLFAAISLILMLWDSKKTAGFSGVTQLLYAIIYTTRYSGAYVGDVIVLNGFEIVLRIALVVSSYVIVYLIYIKFKTDSSLKEDSLRIVYLHIPCALLALIYNPGFTDNVFDYDEVLLFGIPFVEICWAFSYYMESVAILPQLLMLRNRKIHEKQEYVSIYVLIMGLSRIMYSLYSIWERKHDVIIDATGAMQLCIYLGYYLLQIETSQRTARVEFNNVE